MANVQVHLMPPGGKRKAVTIHTLLLEAFVSQRPPKHECRHLNGVRTDNTLGNLAWGTHRQNAFDMWAQGTMPAGERAGASKLNQNQVLAIRQLRSEGATLTGLARAYGVNKTNIWQIVHRKSWRHI